MTRDDVQAYEELARRGSVDTMICFSQGVKPILARRRADLGFKRAASRRRRFACGYEGFNAGHAQVHVVAAAFVAGRGGAEA